MTILVLHQAVPSTFYSKIAPMATFSRLPSPVLPSPQRQNMPNCVSEYAKQDKNIPHLFSCKKHLENRL